MEKVLLKPEEVAQALGLSRTRVYELLGKGMPHVRFGKSIRVPAVELQAWIAERTSESEASTR